MTRAATAQAATASDMGSRNKTSSDMPQGGVLFIPYSVHMPYIEAVHSALTGEKIPSVAAADLEKQLVEITGFKKGPPKLD